MDSWICAESIKWQNVNSFKRPGISYPTECLTWFLIGLHHLSQLALCASNPSDSINFAGWFTVLVLEICVFSLILAVYISYELLPKRLCRKIYSISIHDNILHHFRIYPINDKAPYHYRRHELGVVLPLIVAYALPGKHVGVTHSLSSCKIYLAGSIAAHRLCRFQQFFNHYISHKSFPALC